MTETYVEGNSLEIRVPVTLEGTATAFNLTGWNISAGAQQGDTRVVADTITVDDATSGVIDLVKFDAGTLGAGVWLVQVRISKDASQHTVASFNAVSRPSALAP